MFCKELGNRHILIHVTIFVKVRCYGKKSMYPTMSYTLKNTISEMGYASHASMKRERELKDTIVTTRLTFRMMINRKVIIGTSSLLWYYHFDNTYCQIKKIFSMFQMPFCISELDILLAVIWNCIILAILQMFKIANVTWQTVHSSVHTCTKLCTVYIYVFDVMILTISTTRCSLVINWTQRLCY